MVLLHADSLSGRLRALRDVRDLPPGIADALPTAEDAGRELDHLLLVRVSHWAELEGVADSLLAVSLGPSTVRDLWLMPLQTLQPTRFPSSCAMSSRRIRASTPRPKSAWHSRHRR